MSANMNTKFTGTNHLFSLKDRHALICGASQGIGRATAFTLGSMGAKISLLARSESALNKLAEELKRENIEVGGVLVVDLENLKRLQEEVERLVITKGAVHILLNNAGGPPPGPILKAKPEDFSAALNRLLFSSHTLVQTLLPGMQAENYGRIINVISTSVREPIANLGVSNTVRGATAAWAKTLSMELPPGVTINNILPGFTKTPRLDSLKKSVAEARATSEDQIEREWIQVIPEGRLADPQETAATIAFLASPASSYVRGQSIAVDGGRMKSI